MNIKVGDKVRIKGDLSKCEFGYVYYMDAYKGEKAIVVKVRIGGEIKLDIDKQIWNWSENVLELIKENDNMNTRIEEENKVNELDLKDSEIPKEVEENIEAEEVGHGEEIINDSVNHPSHYTDGKIEVMDFIEDKQLNFARGNVIKYVSRAGKKDPNKELEDLNKAMWYLKREIERLEKEK